MNKTEEKDDFLFRCEIHRTWRLQNEYDFVEELGAPILRPSTTSSGAHIVCRFIFSVIIFSPCSSPLFPPFAWGAGRVVGVAGVGASVAPCGGVAGRVFVGSCAALRCLPCLVPSFPSPPLTLAGLRCLPFFPAPPLPPPLFPPRSPLPCSAPLFPPVLSCLVLLLSSLPSLGHVY